MTKTMLPNNTRLLEFVTGIAIICSGLLILNVPGSLPVSVLESHVNTFWGMIAICFGSIQTIASLLLYRANHLRALISWVMGTFITWVSISTMQTSPNVDDVISLTIGIANLYAFVINLLKVKKEWK